MVDADRGLLCQESFRIEFQNVQLKRLTIENSTDMLLSVPDNAE